MKTESELIQHKYTDKDRFSLDVREWATMRADALNAGRDPSLVIDFDNHRVRLVVHEEPYEES